MNVAILMVAHGRLIYKVSKFNAFFALPYGFGITLQIYFYKPRLLYSVEELQPVA